MKKQILIGAGLLLIISTVLADRAGAQTSQEMTLTSAGVMSEVQPGPNTMWPGFTAHIRWVAEEMNLDEEITGKLVSVAEDHQIKVEEMWAAAGPGLWRRDPAARQQFMKLQIEFHDQIRALLGDDGYVRWRSAWSPGFGPGFAGPGYGYCCYGAGFVAPRGRFGPGRRGGFGPRGMWW